MQDLISCIKRHQSDFETIAAMLASLIVIPVVPRCKFCYRKTTEAARGSRQPLVCKVHRKIDTHLPKANGQVSEKTRLRHANKIAHAYGAVLKVRLAELKQELDADANHEVLTALNVKRRVEPDFPEDERRKALNQSVQCVIGFLRDESAARMRALAQYVCGQSLANEEEIQYNKNYSAEQLEELDKIKVFWNEMLQLPSFFRLYFSGVAQCGTAFEHAPDALMVPIDDRHPSKHWVLGNPDTIPPWVYLNYINSVIPRLTSGLPDLLTDLIAHDTWIESQGTSIDAALSTTGQRLIAPRSRQLEPYQAEIVALRNKLIPTKTGSKRMSFAKIAEHIKTQSKSTVNVSKAAIQQEYELAVIHGNHDADTYEHWKRLHDCGDALTLHGQVLSLDGVRVAGLGGNFLGRTWYPPEEAKFERKETAINRGAFQFRGGQRPNPSFHAAIYPDDYKRLSKIWADILVTHEAPSCHPHGFAALDELARSMRVVRSFHGHHHDDRSAEYALMREEMGFDARAVGYCGITNGLGDIILEAPKG